LEALALLLQRRPKILKSSRFELENISEVFCKTKQVIEDFHGSAKEKNCIT
jgi:hypothetical protein